MRTNSNAYVMPLNQPMLSRQDALALIERCDAKGVPTPFAITFCTADEGRDTGGEIVTLDRAIWHVPGNRVRRSGQFQKGGDCPPADEVRSERSRWTRKIRAVDSDQVRQVHLDLILTLNGQPIR